MFLIYKHHAWLDIPYNLLCLLSALPRLIQCLLSSAMSYQIFTAVLLSEETILFSPAQRHSWLTALSQRESKAEPFSHLILKCKVGKSYRKLFLYCFCAPVPLATYTAARWFKTLTDKGREILLQGCEKQPPAARDCHTFRVGGCRRMQMSGFWSLSSAWCVWLKCPQKCSEKVNLAWLGVSWGVCWGAVASSSEERSLAEYHLCL